MIHAICTYLAHAGTSTLGLTHLPRTWQYLMKGGGPKRNARITFLLFADQERHPRLVARFYRDPAGNACLQKEYETLQALRSTSQPDLQASLPSPLGLVTLGQRLVLFERPFAGIPLACELRGRRLERTIIGQHLADAAQWLVRLHQRAVRLVPPEVWRTQIVTFFTQYASVCAPLSPTEETALQITRHTLQTVAQDLPYTWSHGDFCHKNVLRSPTGSLQVLDWQYGQRHAFFGFDLAHFPLLYLEWFMLHTAPKEPWFASVFLTASHTWEPLVARYCERYLTALSLPPRIVNVILPLGIVRHVLRIHEVYDPPRARANALRWREALEAYGMCPERLLSTWLC